MVLEEVREVQRTEVWESSSKGVQQSETTEKLKVHRKKRDEGDSIHNDLGEGGDTDVSERD